MNRKYTKDDIEEALKELIGQQLTNIGRAGNLLWLSFGEKILVIDRNGCEKFKEKYALHVQCSWRLTTENKISVASKDIYIPRTGLDEDDFDWDEFGANRFDEKIEELKEQIVSSATVSKITADEFGGLKIYFESGIRLEVFPDDSLEDEFWRFIIFGSESKHYVVFDKD